MAFQISCVFKFTFPSLPPSLPRLPSGQVHHSDGRLSMGRSHDRGLCAVGAGGAGSSLVRREGGREGGLCLPVLLDGEKLALVGLGIHW